MAGQNIKGRGQRPNSLEGGGGRYLNFLSTGMAENMGVELGIAAPSVTGQKLFPLPVLWPPS